MTSKATSEYRIYKYLQAELKRAKKHTEELEKALEESFERLTPAEQQRIEPHYAIFSQYAEIGQVGCTTGKSGMEDVLAEEPSYTFKAIPQKECKLCQER